MNSKLSCKNYYAMDIDEISGYIVAINEWLQKYKGFEGEEKAKFALDVAWKAYQLKLLEDPFIKMVLEQVI